MTGLRVLVVDDEPTIVETVSYNLRMENFETVSARAAIAAGRG